MTKTKTIIHEFVHVEIDKIKPHPRNYVNHEADQLEHIAASIKEHGIYRNVIISEDDFILAGHGVVSACIKHFNKEIKKIPVIRLPVKHDSTKALKVLSGENEIRNMRSIDDRALSEILKEINITDELMGTGFDAMKLANLVFVTRPEDEIPDFDAALEWVGLPAYHEKPIDDEFSKENPEVCSVVVKFKSLKDREDWINDIGLEFRTRVGKNWTTEIPFTEKKDVKSLRFESNEDNNHD